MEAWGVEGGDGAYPFELLAQSAESGGPDPGDRASSAGGGDGAGVQAGLETVAGDAPQRPVRPGSGGGDAQMMLRVAPGEPGLAQAGPQQAGLGGSVGMLKREIGARGCRVDQSGEGRGLRTGGQRGREAGGGRSAGQGVAALVLRDAVPEGLVHLQALVELLALPGRIRPGQHHVVVDAQERGREVDARSGAEQFRALLCAAARSYGQPLRPGLEVPRAGPAEAGEYREIGAHLLAVRHGVEDDRVPQRGRGRDQHPGCGGRPVYPHAAVQRTAPGDHQAGRERVRVESVPGLRAPAHRAPPRTVASAGSAMRGRPGSSGVRGRIRLGPAGG